MSISKQDLETIASEILTFIETEKIEDLDSLAKCSGKTFRYSGFMGIIYINEKESYLGSMAQSIVYDIPPGRTVLEIEMNRTYSITRIYFTSSCIKEGYKPWTQKESLEVVQEMALAGCHIGSVKRAMERLRSNGKPSL